MTREEKKSPLLFSARQFGFLLRMKTKSIDAVYFIELRFLFLFFCG